MLVLTRKVGDSILVGDSIRIQVVKVKGLQVRLGIEAPKETKIFRQEILKNSQKDEKSASPVNIEANKETSLHTPA